MSRVKLALRSTAGPTIAMLFILAFIVMLRWSQFADNPLLAIVLVSGLALVVFLTYFVLALAGFKASASGVVNAPRVYGWFVASVVVIVVFGVLFYVMHFLLHI